MTHSSPLHRLGAVACAAALLAGCAGARHEPLPAVAMPANWEAPVAAGAPATSRDWWRSFGDPQLDALIDDALRANNDLAIAAIRVYRAQLQAGAADTNLTPNVSVGANGAVSRTLDTHRMSRTSGVTGSLSYEIDLRGRLAALRDAARWEADATAADLEAARLSLIGTTASLYWQIGYLNRQIALGDANIAYAVRTLAVVRSRHTAGAVSPISRRPNRASPRNAPRRRN